MELCLYTGQPVMVCKTLQDESEELLMTFKFISQVNGKHYATDTLIDTGTTHCFVDKQFVESNGWQTEFEEGQVTCAGDSVIQIQGLLKTKLQIQGFFQHT